MAKVVVLSRNASGLPEFPGNTWVQLQYLLGLERLGVESYWIDYLRPIDPFRYPHTLDYLLDRFVTTARDFGFADRWGIVYDKGAREFGLNGQAVDDLAQNADLVLCISGHLPAGSPFELVPVRAYVDIDPGFTQIWAHEWDMGFERFHFFFTTGQNVGRSGFRIPTNGIEWRPLLPPVVLDLWPAAVDDRCRRYSTIADWRGSQEAVFDGETFGGKREQFMAVLGVPEASGARVEVALCIGPQDHEDLGLLARHGWKVRDPYAVAGDPHSYREFIRYSRAEFSVAKGGYVRSRSGWISDRTACYLASGKPCVLQSTGFEDSLPTDGGVLTFTTADEADERIRDVEADYLAHCQAARRLAEERFDARVVLGSLLEQVGL